MADNLLNYITETDLSFDCQVLVSLQGLVLVEVNSSFFARGSKVDWQGVEDDKFLRVFGLMCIAVHCGDELRLPGVQRLITALDHCAKIGLW